METVFSLMDGDPSLARDAKPAADFYVQLEKERIKVGVGMVSQRYQRLERRLLGKQVGPDTLDRGALGAPAGSVGLGASTPDVPLADKMRKNPPPKDERKMLAEYARFLPAANSGQTTPLKELQKVGAVRVNRRAHAVAHAMGTPQRVCLELTPEVRKKLGELGVTSGGMLRAAPNPIRDAAKLAKAQEVSDLRRPSRMPRSHLPAGQAVAAPRALSPQTPRRVDTGAMRRAAPSPPRAATSTNSSQSVRVHLLPQSVGKRASRASPHSARASSSARAGSPTRPSAVSWAGAGNSMGYDNPTHEQMQKFVERREAAMRRQADSFLEQQSRVAKAASWALAQESRSGEEKMHAQAEAAERAARRRSSEARQRHDKVSKEVTEEAKANQRRAVELMQARCREMSARAATEKRFRESIVEVRQKEAKERVVERARRVQQREEALLRYQELNAANMEAAAERRENLRPAPRSEAMEARRQDAERVRVARWDDRDFETHQALNKWKAKAAKADEYQRQVLQEQKKDHLKRRGREVRDRRPRAIGSGGARSRTCSQPGAPQTHRTFTRHFEISRASENVALIPALVSPRRARL
jgi:hypothetical protein